MLPVGRRMARIWAAGGGSLLLLLLQPLHAQVNGAYPVAVEVSGPGAPAAASAASWRGPVRTGLANAQAHLAQWGRDVRLRQRAYYPGSSSAGARSQAAGQAAAASAAALPKTASSSSRPGWNPLSWAPQLNLRSPGLAATLRNGEQAEHRGDFESAVRWYEKAVRIDPSDAVARSRLAAAKSLRNTAAAQKGWSGLR